MKGMFNKAQIFLLENDCDDLVLNEYKPRPYKYTSDIMIKFVEQENAKLKEEVRELQSDVDHLTKWKDRT